MSKQTQKDVSAVEVAQQHHIELLRAESELHRKLLTTRTQHQFGNWIKFGLTAVTIFTIMFIALNFSAYKKQAVFWLENTKANLLAQLEIPSPTSGTGSLITEIEPSKLTFQDIQSSIGLTGERTHPPILTSVAPPDNRIIIPRLKIYAPIRDIDRVDTSGGDWKKIEDQIQEALRDGVVHFPGTAKPGERGNVFITGHSSYYPWGDGRYKDIFALLPQIEIGDEIVIWQDQQRYLYRVSEMKEVRPSATDVLAATDDNRLTLMTCVPIGTSLKRLIVTAHLVEAI